MKRFSTNYLFTVKSEDDYDFLTTKKGSKKNPKKVKDAYDDYEYESNRRRK